MGKGESTPTPPRLNVDGFRGVVHLHNWIRWIDGQQYDSLVGYVRILSDEEATGFKATGHNTANWIARIEGEESSVNVMGCQVRAVFESQTMSLETLAAPAATLLVP